MKFLHDIQAHQVSDDLTSEMALILVNKIVKKRNLGDLYLKGLTMNMPNIFNPVTATATPAASTLTYSLANQTAKSVFAAPIANNGTPTFRALTLADVQDFYTSVDKTQLNYWTKTGSDVYYNSGNVYIGHSSSLGAYKLQVTGNSVFEGNVTINGTGTNAAFGVYLGGTTLLELNNTQVYTEKPIYSLPLDGSPTLLKTINGIITRATSAEIADFLGAASNEYIKNQFVAAQSGSFWISGQARIDGYFHVNSSVPTIQISRGGVAKAYIGVAEAANSFATGTAIDDVIFRTQGGALHFVTNGGGSSAMYINSSQNVGIKNTSPYASLHVAYSQGTEGFTALGSTATGRTVMISNSNGLYGLHIGVSPYGESWIQSGRADSATAYNLILQHEGGNVGICTTSPSDKLTLEGGNLGIKSGGYLKLYHSANNNWSSIYSPASGVFAVNTGGVTNALYLDTYGSLGIGTTTPTGKLNVYQSATLGQFIFGFGGTSTTYVDQDDIYFRSGANGVAKMQLNNGASYFWGFIEVRPYNTASPYGTFNITAGSSTSNAYISFTNPSNNRIGYIGYSTTEMYYMAENSANHVFAGGKVLIGTGSTYTGSVFQVNGSITQRSVFSGMLYADANGQLVAATASHIAATLGAGNYIQNQFSAAQSGNFWISNTGTAADFKVNGSIPQILFERASVAKAFIAISPYANGFINGSATDELIFRTQGTGIVYSIDSGGTIAVKIAANGNIGFGSGNNPLGSVQIGSYNNLRDNDLVLWANGGGVNSGNSIKFDMFVAGGVSRSKIAEIKSLSYQNGGYGQLQIITGDWNNNNSGAVGMVVQSSGVGIGTTNPEVKLDVIGDVVFGRQGGSRWYFQSPSSDMRIVGTTANANFAIIPSGGKVLIGTISPNGTWKLQVDSGSTSGNGLYVSGKIYATDMVTSMSDKRQKKSITDLVIGNRLDRINIKRYKFRKATDGRFHIGVLAQDFESIFPELVDEQQGIKSFDYLGLSAVALGLGLETKKRVDSVEQRVKTLEEENKQLKTQITQLLKQTKNHASK